jgi:hypothetical protein
MENQTIFVPRILCFENISRLYYSIFWRGSLSLINSYVKAFVNISTEFAAAPCLKYSTHGIIFRMQLKRNNIIYYYTRKRYQNPFVNRHRTYFRSSNDAKMRFQLQWRLTPSKCGSDQLSYVLPTGFLFRMKRLPLDTADWSAWGENESTYSFVLFTICFCWFKWPTVSRSVWFGVSFFCLTVLWMHARKPILAL